MVIFQHDIGFIKNARSNNRLESSDEDVLSAHSEFVDVKEQLMSFVKGLASDGVKLDAVPLDRLARFIFQFDLPQTLDIASVDLLETVFERILQKYYPYIAEDEDLDIILNKPLYPSWEANTNLSTPTPVTTGVHQFEVTLSRSSFLVGWSCCFTQHEVNDKMVTDRKFEHIMAHVEKVGPIDTLYMSGETVSCMLDADSQEIVVWTESYKSAQKIVIDPSAVPPGATIFYIPIVMIEHSKFYPNFGHMPFSLKSNDDPQPIYQINKSRHQRLRYIYNCLYRLIKLRQISDFPEYENLFKFLLLKITTPVINNFCVYKYLYPMVEEIVVTSQPLFEVFFNSVKSSDYDNSGELFRIIFSRALFLKRTRTTSRNFYPHLVLKEILSIAPLRHLYLTDSNVHDVLEILFSQRPLIFLEFLQNQPITSNSTTNFLENRFICRKKDERNIQMEIFKCLVSDPLFSSVLVNWIKVSITTGYTHVKRIIQSNNTEQMELTTLNNLFFIITQYLDSYLSDIRNTKSFPISTFYFTEPQRQRVGGVHSHLKKNVVIPEYDGAGEPELDLKQKLYLYSIDLLQLSFCSYLTLIQKLDAASKMEKRELDRAFDYADYLKVKSSQEATQLKADYLRTEMLEKSEHYEYLWKHLAFNITLITDNLDKPIFEYIFDDTILTSLSIFTYLLGWNVKSTFQNLNLQTTTNILTLILKKHGSVVDREIIKATTDTVCEFLKRQVFHSMISYHKFFRHFVHMLLEGLTNMDVDLLTFLCTRKFDTFLTCFREICLENPSCLLKLLNVIFSNLSENISSKHEIPLRLRMFNYLCQNLPHIITENETSLLITGQFIMYIMDKLLLHPNSRDNVYYITFVNMLPSIFSLNKHSKEYSLKQTISKVNPKIIQMLTDVSCSPEFTQPKKREVIKFFQSILDEEKKSLNTSVGSSDNLCNICYTYDANVIFNPCKHTSCQHCVTRQLLTKKICFFCREEIASTQKVDQII